MDSRSRSGSGGGGRPPLRDGEQPALALDWIRVISSSNDYTDGPPSADAPQQAAPGRTVEPGSPAAGSEDKMEEQIILLQPGRQELKPLTADAPAPVQVVPGSISSDKEHKHYKKCKNCGRCTCAECRRQQAPPSCWLCGRRCLCSARSTVEHCTCICCLKGVLYHCSSDDEDTCADKPFSCSEAHCAARWAAVVLLSLCCPCLLCYPLAAACVDACERCYNGPGCRCHRAAT